MIYELTYIITPEADSKKLTLISEEIDKIIKEAGGKIIKSIRKTTKENVNEIKEISESQEFFKDTTKQKLAYPIRGFNFGCYKTVNFSIDLDGEDISEGKRLSIMNLLDSKLKLMDDVIRYLVIKREDISKKIKKEEKKKPKKVSSTGKKEPEEILEEDKIKKKKLKKIKLEEIEEKLDKILDI